MVSCNVDVLLASSVWVQPRLHERVCLLHQKEINYEIRTKRHPSLVFASVPASRCLLWIPTPLLFLMDYHQDPSAQTKLSLRKLLLVRKFYPSDRKQPERKEEKRCFKKYWWYYFGNELRSCREEGQDSDCCWYGRGSAGFLTRVLRIVEFRESSWCLFALRYGFTM